MTFIKSMDSNLICITCAQSNFFSVKAKLTSHNHSVFKITKNVSWFEQHSFLRKIKSKLVSCSLNSSETFLMVFKTWWLFLQGSRTEFHISRENFLVCSVLIYELRWWLHFLNEGSILQVSNKQGKAYTFFLSSEYERSQWVETLQVTYLVIYNFTTYFLHFWKRNSFWEMGENWNENLLWFSGLAIVITSQPHHIRSGQEYVNVRITSLDYILQKVFEDQHGLISNAKSKRWAFTLWRPSFSCDLFTRLNATFRLICGLGSGLLWTLFP